MRKLTFLLLAAALALGAIGLIGWTNREQLDEVLGRLAATERSPDETELSIGEVVQRTMPAVVYIEAETEEGTKQGTGLVIEPDGHLLTALHVVDDATTIRVTLDDGSKLQAERFLAHDPAYDLVLLELPAGERPAVDPDFPGLPEVGSEVVVIGHPVGLAGTVSEGIVSALRPLSNGGSVIQTTAAISPGNSGGPVFDRRGRLLGIVSFKVASARVDNIGFAVPGSLLPGLPKLPTPLRPLDFRDRRVGERRRDPWAGDVRKAIGLGPDPSSLTGVWQDRSAPHEITLIRERSSGIDGVRFILQRGVEIEPVELKRLIEHRDLTSLRGLQELRLESIGDDEYRGEASFPWSCAPRAGLSKRCSVQRELELIRTSPDELIGLWHEREKPSEGGNAWSAYCKSCQNSGKRTQRDFEWVRVALP